MDSGGLGREYENKETIIQQGEAGNCMYVIQEGTVEIIRNNDEKEVLLAVRGEGEFFGEMALFSKEVRSATVRSLGKSRILTIDKRNLLQNIQKDPTLAFKIIETMSERIREISVEMAEIKSTK
jgi:CRP/FNR family transcriptional regulator